MEDKKIIRLLFARSETAIDALAAKSGKRLYRTAMNILGIHEDAEEAVSDTYLAVWNAIPPKEPDPLAGFVYKTGRYTALRKLRDAAAQKRDDRGNVPLSELENCLAGTDLLQTVTARELGRCINRFLAAQSTENRAIFLRRYWFGDSVKDIAKHIGLSENVISVRLSRLRDKLKTELIQEGYYDG